MKQYILLIALLVLAIAKLLSDFYFDPTIIAPSLTILFVAIMSFMAGRFSHLD